MIALYNQYSPIEQSLTPIEHSSDTVLLKNCNTWLGSITACLLGDMNIAEPSI